MLRAKRRKTLTGMAGVRLTPAEDDHLKQCAEAAGVTKSEWCRRVILNALDTPPETRLLLSEFLALRALVLALHTDILQGNKLTEQRIAAAIQQVEARKFAMAENRLQTFALNGKPSGPEPPAS